MAEPTLSGTYWNALDEVSDYLGTGRGTNITDEEDLARVREALEAGYRQFLYPPVLPNDTEMHEWSFLSPTATFDTAATDVDYDLADDFGGIVGAVTMTNSGKSRKLRERSRGWIQERQARTDTTGAPRYFAIRAKAFTNTTGQRWEMLVWPDPDGVYTVEYQYRVLADKWGTVITTNTGTVDTSEKTLTKTGETFVTKAVAAGDYVILSSVASGQTAGIYTVSAVTGETVLTLTTAPGADGDCTYEVLADTLYSYGGVPHWAALLESCLSIAEQRRDDTVGLHYQKFMERLNASVATDRRMQTRIYGYNSDESDQVAGSRSTWYVEVEGTVYGEYAP